MATFGYSLARHKLGTRLPFDWPVTRSCSALGRVSGRFALFDRRLDALSAQLTMSSAHTTPKAAAAPLDRRSHPRETPEWLALVFLDADNWGKLHNLSETGMAFEFSQPVSLRTSSTFVLESIRLMSAQDGDLTLNSIQTPGQIVWADESGRTAGVRFTDDFAE